MLLARNSRLLVIIGPSGSGKTTVVSQLDAEGLVDVTPSWTTRPRRTEEMTGAHEHIFCDDSTFENKIRHSEFIDTVAMFGLPFRYGLTPISTPPKGKIPLIMLRVAILDLLYKHYDRPVIYQIEAPKTDVAKRLTERQDKGIPLGTRLSDYEKELTMGREVASRVFVNKNIADTVAAIKTAIIEDF